MKIFKEYSVVRKNARLKGHIYGFLLFGLYFYLIPPIVIILAAIIFGDGHYYDLGMFFGLISGCYVYYHMLKKYPKK